MAALADRVRDFFKAYGERSNRAVQSAEDTDAEAIVAGFAPYFVASSPAGIMGGAKDDGFADMVRDGFAHYREIGATAFVVTGIEVTVFDDIHAMAAVDWRFDYTRPSDGKSGTIAFTNRYLVNGAGDRIVCFAWMTPDEQQALKDHGLA